MSVGLVASTSDLSNHVAWALPGGKADQVEVHGKNRAWVEERVPLRHISFSPISGPYLDPLFFRSLSGYLACPLSKKIPQPHASCTLPQPYPVSSHGFQTEPGTRSSSLTLPKPRHDPSHLLSIVPFFWAPETFLPKRHGEKLSDRRQCLLLALHGRKAAPKECVGRNMDGERQRQTSYTSLPSTLSNYISEQPDDTSQSLPLGKRTFFAHSQRAGKIREQTRT